jgi:hypothetical protein
MSGIPDTEQTKMTITNKKDRKIINFTDIVSCFEGVEFLKKAIQNKAIGPKVESSPKSYYCILFNKLRKMRKQHGLSDFSYWM